MTIIVNLDVMLAKRKMRLNELSERTGISIQNLSVLKTGKARAVRFTTLNLICEALGCQPGDILEFKTGPQDEGADIGALGRHLFNFFMIGAVGLLSACTPVRDVPPVGASLPQAFQQKSVGDTPTKLRGDWWNSANDPTLRSILLQIEAQNLSLEQARFRLAAARATTRSLDFLPSLTATTDAQYNRLVDGETAIQNVGIPQAGGAKTTGFYNAKIDASWELPLFGQYNAASKIENANIAFAKADIEAVRASVMAEAIRLYTDMRMKQNEVKLRQAIYGASKKIADYQALKHKAGLITDSILGDSNQAALTAQNDVQTAQSEWVAKRYQLAKLLGKTTPDKEWEKAGDIPRFGLAVFDDTPLDVLRNRPDIRKSEATVLAAAGEVDLAKSDLYPKLTLTGNLSQLVNLTGDPLPGKTVQLGGVPSLSLPLFDWGKRRAYAKMKNENLLEAASAYRETVIGAITEVEEFWSAYQAAYNTEITAQKNLAIAEQTHQQAMLLHRQGVSDGIEVENADIALSRSAMAHVQARADTITKLVTLTKALGGTNP
jgi:NodT family efflux transporter outer membrane factor (OMF) lipoprotein